MATDIKIDKEFQALIPPLSPDELRNLDASLQAEGCREPLLVWKGHGVLLDGHNRLSICRKHKIPFKTVEVDLPDREAARSFIVRNQLSRRNLSPEAASYLRGQRYLAMKHQGKRSATSGQSGQKLEGTSGHSDQKSTAEVLAAEYSVGEKTIRRDGRFTLLVDAIVENCGADARQQLLSREAGLTRGMVVRLSRLSPAKQQASWRN